MKLNKFLLQVVAQATRLGKFMSPVMFGVGVEMDIKFRSKWLINHLSRLGFSVSYDEVSAYKRSVMHANQSQTPKTTYPE